MIEMNPASPWWLAVAAAVGAALGRLLTIAVGRWLAATTEGRMRAPVPRWVEPVAIAAAVALWWWEVRCLGGLPAALEGDPEAASAAMLMPRYLAHLVLFWLLAAATWIDLRQRVIPDWITLPGVLAGLLCVWAWPDVLLPVGIDVPRSFAAPQITGDVLGFLGGLHATAGGDWLGSAPHVVGLTLAIGLFVAWWLVCTDPASDDGRWRLLEPRNILLVAGILAIVGAWLVGTVRFRGLQSALVGMAVSGGIVWATRAGASRALGREAMGLGDVTLMAMVGAWLGWQACVLAFFLAAFIGLAHGLFQLVRHQESELPFGPSLCLAAAGVVVGWRPLWERAGIHFEQPGVLALVVGTAIALTAVTLFFWRLVRDRVPGR